MNRWLFCLSILLCLPLSARASAILSDSIPPAINCPDNDTLLLSQGECALAYTYTVAAYDDQPGFTVTQTSGLPSGSEFPIGLTVNHFVVEDSGGNTDACAFTVTVLPASTVLLCKDMITVSLDSSCSYTLQFEELLDPPYGCLDKYGIQMDFSLPLGNGPWSEPVFNPAMVGKTFAFRVTDSLSGNTCWGLMKVEDLTPPILSCPTIDVPCILDDVSPEFLRDSMLIAAAFPQVSDNCSMSLNLSFTDQVQLIPCIPDTTVSMVVRRIWTTEDDAGNFASCMQLILKRRDLDAVQFPPDITLGCQDLIPGPEVSGAPFLELLNDIFPVSEELNCYLDALYQDSVMTVCGGDRVVAREWSVFDVCADLSAGNPRIYTQIIELKDTLGPDIDCPPAIAVRLDGVNCTGRAVLPDMVVYENCAPIAGITASWSAAGNNYTQEGVLIDWPGNMPFLIDTLARFDTLPLLQAGETVFTFTASDTCGNTSLCETVVTALDSLPPFPQCDSLLAVHLPAEGIANLAAFLLDQGSMDACSPVFFKARRVLPGCSADTLWRDEIRFCCEDVGDTIEVQLRVFDFQPLGGPVSGNYGAGNAADCTARVRVTADSLPGCAAPPDTAVACTGFDMSLSAYGWPLLSCSVDTLLVEVDASAFDSLCMRGEIVRTFRALNGLGDTAACMQKITALPVDGFYLRFPADTIVNQCDSSGIYGVPEWLNLGCSELEVTFTDQIFTVVPDACFRIDRTWQVINPCADTAQLLIEIPNPAPEGQPNHPSNLQGPVVSAPGATGMWTSSIVKITPSDGQPTDFSSFWQASARGYTYQQMIKIVDLEPAQIANCPAVPVIYTDTTANDTMFWNDDFYPGGVDFCEGRVGLSLLVSDLCGSDRVEARYILSLDFNGDGEIDTEIDSRNLPAPGLVIVDGMTKFFDNRPVPGPQRFAWAVDKQVSAQTATFRVVWNTVQNPATKILPLIPPGQHHIRWFFNDNCGNESVCEYDFTVENDLPDCLGQRPDLSGVLRTEEGEGVQYANVRLQYAGPGGSAPDMEVESGMDGSYLFSPGVPYGGVLTLRPERNDNHLNGVTTFDLLTINKHILGIESLGSLYKIVAADANRSNSLTVFDIVELRRLILGIYDELPNNTSWRFIPDTFQFVDTLNPFASTFPEQVFDPEYVPMDGTVNNFVGMKVGDVNNTSVSNGLLSPEDRDRPVLPVGLKDVRMLPGEEYRIELSPPEALLGWQYTLNYAGLEVWEILPGSAMSEEHFAHFPESGAVTVSWNAGREAVEPAFSIRVKALQEGWLSDCIWMSDAVTLAEAYATNGQVLRPELQFAASEKPQEFRVLGLYPNPASEQSTLFVYLPESGPVRLVVYDVHGKTLMDNVFSGQAGYFQLPIDLAATGVYGAIQVGVQFGRQVEHIRLIRLR